MRPLLAAVATRVDASSTIAARRVRSTRGSQGQLPSKTQAPNMSTLMRPIAWSTTQCKCRSMRPFSCGCCYTSIAASIAIHRLKKSSVALGCNQHGRQRRAVARRRHNARRPNGPERPHGRWHDTGRWRVGWRPRRRLGRGRWAADGRWRHSGGMLPSQSACACTLRGRRIAEHAALAAALANSESASSPRPALTAPIQYAYTARPDRCVEWAPCTEAKSVPPSRDCTEKYSLK